jgi:ribosomal-protein-alanine N-acetyltransferase
MFSPIARVELVELTVDGVPAKEVGMLSEDATEACAATVAHYKRAGFSPPWISYLAILGSKVVGICAFTAAPAGGRVEIAYNTFPPFEGRGAATAMVAELIALARATQPGVGIFAQTLPEHNASNKVLRKLGFEFAGALDHPEEGRVWEWRMIANI